MAMTDGGREGNIEIRLPKLTGNVGYVPVASNRACLFTSHKKKITPSLHVLHICLFGQYGSRKQRTRNYQKVNELVQRNQRHIKI